MAENNRQIRVMRIIARLNIGGPAIHVTLLTEKLNPEVFDSRLVVGSISEDEGDMSYYALEHGVQPTVIPNLRREISPIQDIRVLIAVYQLMKEWQPDVVHTHTAKAGFIGRLAAKLAGVPVIVHTFHGHVFKGYFGTLKTQVFIELERLAARLSDTIITLTDSLRRELAEDYKITRKSHITVLPLGLDLLPFTNAQRKSGDFRKAWDIPEDAPLIGIVARMAPVKNLHLFVDVAKKVLEAKPDAYFVIVGDGDMCMEIRTYAQKQGLKERMVFTGWLKETASAYADFDVKVITSRNEGTPVTIIEALAAGCPVVATRVGGMSDLLDGGDFGRLVRVNSENVADATEFANEVLATLDNPPDTEAARRAMVNRYGIDRLTRDIDSLYQGLLIRKRAHPGHHVLQEASTTG
jgi:glycosyltransferase involved in cell wall biosynthesis